MDTLVSIWRYYDQYKFRKIVADEVPIFVFLWNALILPQKLQIKQPQKFKNEKKKKKNQRKFRNRKFQIVETSVPMCCVVTWYDTCFCHVVFSVRLTVRRRAWAASAVRTSPSGGTGTTPRPLPPPPTPPPPPTTLLPRPPPPTTLRPRPPPPPPTPAPSTATRLRAR